MKIILFRFVFALILSLSTYGPSFAQQKKDYAALVNPFIGTGGHGHTYPGAVVPFGMVQLSPDTRLDGWDACSGYYCTDTTVYGFSHTHLSGTGIPDYFDVLFMPTTGEPQFMNTEYRSGFQKKNETASPGFYRTKLDKYNIGVELTATTRVGMHRYTYPNTTKANIIIDLQHRDQVLDSWIEVVNDHEIRGFRESKSWAQDQYVYFYAKFSKPFKTYGIAADNNLQAGQKKVQGKNIKMFIQFDNPGEVITKVGISAVSTEGALKNLDAEVPGFDFKKVQTNARAAWNTELNKIQVEGSAPLTTVAIADQTKNKQIIFYTALYHAMVAPNIYNDVDGKYRGLDQKIHKADGFNYYTVFSLWDTFRAEDPLFALIEPKRTVDFIKTFLAMYEQVGLLPIWPLGSGETYCMTGNHSIPVIVDAYAKGIRGFDPEEALTAMKAAVNRNQFGLDVYRKNGVLLATKDNESVSKTLEYAYDDWCIAQMARMLNKPVDYREFIQRAQYWKNVYNNQTGFVQARVNGGWYQPFNPAELNGNYTEGNAWQYSFLVPQDVDGLISRMGGKDKFEKKLDDLFNTDSKLSGNDIPDVSGLIGQYAHGNEPSHHIAYLFNFTNSPQKTQFYLNRILKEEYSNQPDGLAGNEDCGQMSAWYVMSALGIYTIAPGQTQFQIGSPQFTKAVINLENGKKFTITNNGAAANNSIYLQGMSLDKKPYHKLFIENAALVNGGELDFQTGKTASKRFMQSLQKPVSKITDELIVSNPYIISASASFKQPVAVEIKCAEPGAKIYYTLNGSTPGTTATLYQKPFTIENTTTIKAIAVKDGRSSFVDESTLTKLP